VKKDDRQDLSGWFPPKAGNRPAAFTKYMGLAVVCPITSRVRPFPTSVVLPPGLPISGEVLISHIRSIDTVALPIRYAGAAVPAEFGSSSARS
jgi:mRNA-degrading endonuclease toxin of MazEF toxin-antitoxin module